MSSEITLLLTRGFGVQSINTSFDAEFASRPAQAECARGTGAHQKVRVRTTPPTPDPLAASPRHPTRVFERS